jgi:hypothetical protein
MRALKRNPAERYANGQVMSDDLEEVLAETKFQSRMLPRLLIDLFGSGRQSCQLAMSTLTPELLAAADPSELSRVEVKEPGSGIGIEPAKAFRSPRVWLAVGAAGTLGLGAILLSVFVGGTKPQPEGIPALPPIVPAAAVSPPSEVPALPPKAVAETTDVEPPLPVKVNVKEKTPAVPRKASATRVRENRISSGLSIDPFAEAARRGGK